MNDPSSSIADFTHVVEVDPALSARVLRMANSAFFGFSARIDNISRAINIMGVSQLHDLVLATSAASAFKGLCSVRMDMHKFWGDSIHCAINCRLLAAECDIIDTDRLFITGLLHDIGHLVMFNCITEQCGEMLEKAHDEGIPLELLERQMLGFDAAEVGAELLKIWLLPESVIRVIRDQHMPEQAEKYLLDTCILYLARHLGRDDMNKSELSPERKFALDLTGLGEQELQIVCRESKLHYEETHALVLPHGMVKAA
jgi:HD-like signal output (HDOD) protein